jgi:hypothetical protein
MSFLEEEYRTYRWFYTRAGTLVVGGKSATQNDMLLEHVLTTAETHLISHTAEPGSAFMVLCIPASQASEADIREMAIVTACFSKAWKQGKHKANVHLFSSTQIHKAKGMKPGTWGVYGEVTTYTVPLKLTLQQQKGILRAIPPAIQSRKKQLILMPGTLPKDEALPKIELELDRPLKQEEVLQALPAGSCKIIHE